MSVSNENQFEPWQPFNLVCFDFDHVVDNEELKQVLDVDEEVANIISDIAWKDRYGHS